MTQVLILDKNAPAYRDGLAAAFPQLSIEAIKNVADAGDAIAKAEVIVMTHGPQLSRDLFATASKLKWIQALVTGTDYYVELLAERPDIQLTSTRGIHTTQMSELALIHMFMLNRGFRRIIHNEDKGHWDRLDQRVLEEKTVGILGVGVIGEELAKRCKALGMTVIGISRTERELAGFDRFYSRERLAEAAAEVDFLIVLVPLEPETRFIVDGKIIGAMKENAYLINIARGGVVDEDALIEAVNAGRIAGAGLDAFITEPLPPEHPFWGMENILVTPKLGGASDLYIKRALPILEHNFDCYLKGNTGAMMNVVPH
jgi:phosphoglycerate dehydrogenase-like enzyme